MTSPDSILKSRDIILLTKVCTVKPMVFLLVIYGCESWIIKKADHKELDHKELMLFNCGAGEDPSEFLGLKGEKTIQS